MKWCILSLFHRKPHVASSSAFLKGKMQGRRRGEEWDRGYDGRKCTTWTFLINSTHSLQKAVTNADMHYYIVRLEKSKFTLWLSEAGVDFLNVSVLSVISLWKSWPEICFTGVVIIKADFDHKGRVCLHNFCTLTMFTPVNIHQDSRSSTL